MIDNDKNVKCISSSMYIIRKFCFHQYAFIDQLRFIIEQKNIKQNYEINLTNFLMMFVSVLNLTQT